MADKYFAYMTGMTAVDIGGPTHIKATADVFGIDVDDNHADGFVSVGVFLESTDTSQSIHDNLADAIREHFSDASIRVVFLDAPGRF